MKVNRYTLVISVCFYYILRLVFSIYNSVTYLLDFSFYIIQC